MKVFEGFDLILNHRNIIQKENNWLKSSKPPIFRGIFRYLTCGDGSKHCMIDQLKGVTQYKKCSKTAAKV